MVKAKWSATDVTADDIDNVEEDEFQPYDGPTPPAGVYRFILRYSRKRVSSKGNDMIENLLILDGSFKPEHKEYDGCPVWDYITIKKSTAARVRSFIDALGVSSSDFLNRTVVDEEDRILKIGSVKIADANLKLMVNCELEDSELGQRLRPRFRGYIPKRDENESVMQEEEEGEEEERPAPKKRKAQAEEDPPF